MIFTHSESSSHCAQFTLPGFIVVLFINLNLLLVPAIICVGIFHHFWLHVPWLLERSLNLQLGHGNLVFLFRASKFHKSIWLIIFLGWTYGHNNYCLSESTLHYCIQGCFYWKERPLSHPNYLFVSYTYQLKKVLYIPSVSQFSS